MLPRHSYWVALGLLLIACGGGDGGESLPVAEETMMSQAPLAEVLARHAPKLIERPEVQAVYESLDDQDRRCIKLLVSGLSDQLRSELPSEIEGWPVVLEESDEIRPLGNGS